jgi:hypothetical protein
MRECYTQLKQINDELVRSYSVRSANHKELLETLRYINTVVQHAARLRGNIVSIY